MSADLLIAYTRSGGAPPATLESLRVHADGSARAIVTNAWPDGAPQDEAGLYETTLGDDVLAELRALAADPELLGLPASLGEVRSDSGETGLSLAGERKSWGAFAELPAPLRAAEARLRELLGEVRRHPRVAVRLELARRGDDQLELAVTSIGSEPVRSSLLVTPARVARVDGDLPRPVPLSLYREAARARAGRAARRRAARARGDATGRRAGAGGQRRRCSSSRRSRSSCRRTATSSRSTGSSWPDPRRVRRR